MFPVSPSRANAIQTQAAILVLKRASARSSTLPVVRLGLLTLCLSFSLSGCGTPFWLPPAHKIEVQQGNLVSASQRKSIVVGLSREQVLSTLGQPLSDAIFHDNRWDYFYTKGPAGSTLNARRLTLYFDNDKVVRLSDNFATETGEPPPATPWWRRLFSAG